MAIGPVQLIVLGFPDPDFHGQIIAEVERLRESDTIRVIDSLAVYKDASGEIEAMHLSNLSQDEAIELGSKVGALIGLGFEGEEGMEAGAEAGAEAAAAAKAPTETAPLRLPPGGLVIDPARRRHLLHGRRADRHRPHPPRHHPGYDDLLLRPGGNRNEVFAGLGYRVHHDFPTINWTVDQLAKGIFYHARELNDAFTSVFT